MKYYTQYVSRIRVQGQLKPPHKSNKREVDERLYLHCRQKYPTAQEKTSTNHKLLLINLGTFVVPF